MPPRENPVGRQTAVQTPSQEDGLALVMEVRKATTGKDHIPGWLVERARFLSNEQADEGVGCRPGGLPHSNTLIEVCGNRAVGGIKRSLDIGMFCLGPPAILEGAMMSNPDNGIVTIPGRRSVDETVQKLQSILEAKGVKLFALVDHSGEAEKAGMQMRPTRLLIFGNPQAGTPLMIASPSAAIDLPLKILVWEDAERKVWLSYNSPEYLRKRHGFPPELVENIAVAGAFAMRAAE
jgi:uncharacterized protein (DUF302 family)